MRGPASHPSHTRWIPGWSKNPVVTGPYCHTPVKRKQFSEVRVKLLFNTMEWAWGLSQTSTPRLLQTTSSTYSSLSPRGLETEEKKAVLSNKGGNAYHLQRKKPVSIQTAQRQNFRVCWHRPTGTRGRRMLRAQYSSEADSSRYLSNWFGTYIHIKICTWMFTVALFITAKLWEKSRSPSMKDTEWMNEWVVNG